MHPTIEEKNDDEASQDKEEADDNEDDSEFGDFRRRKRSTYDRKQNISPRETEKDSKLKGGVPGFTLKWQLQDSVKEINNSEGETVWNGQTLYKKDENMMTIMNLVRESKINGVAEEDVWRTLLEHRWSKEIIQSSGCLSQNQIAEVIFNTGKELKLAYDYFSWNPEDDMSFGIELYSFNAQIISWKQPSCCSSMNIY